MPWKAPKPRKGGSQDHRCDDRGVVNEKNGRIYTHCSVCGDVVAIDKVEDID